MHPWYWLDSGYFRWITLASLGIATLAMMECLRRLGSALRPGIVSFEFAFTKERAQKILISWRTTMGIARREIRADFLFLLVYPATLSLACAMLADSGTDRFARLGLVLAWAILAAGPLDAVENLSLLRMLHRGANAPLAMLAGFCAATKFALLLAVLIYFVLGGPVAFIEWLRT